MVRLISTLNTNSKRTTEEISSKKLSVRTVTNATPAKFEESLPHKCICNLATRGPDPHSLTSIHEDQERHIQSGQGRTSGTTAVNITDQRGRWLLIDDVTSADGKMFAI